MLTKMMLAPRVLIAFLALGIIPLLVAGASSLMQVSNALHKAACSNLVGLKEFNGAA